MKAALSATCGDNSEEDPPVPIPNTVVKLLSADDTWGVTLWEIRTSPLFLCLKQYGLQRINLRDRFLYT